MSFQIPEAKLREHNGAIVAMPTIKLTTKFCVTHPERLAVVDLTEPSGTQNSVHICRTKAGNTSTFELSRGFDWRGLHLANYDRRMC